MYLLSSQQNCIKSAFHWTNNVMHTCILFSIPKSKNEWCIRPSAQQTENTLYTKVSIKKHKSLLVFLSPFNIELTVCVPLSPNNPWLLNRMPCVYSGELQLSKEVVCGSNNVCPSAACGDRQTVLVSDSLLKRCCKIVNHLTLHVTPYTLLPVVLMPQNTKISFSVFVSRYLSCSTLPPFLCFPLYNMPPSNNHISFQLPFFFFPPGWMQACQGDSRLQQQRDKAAFFCQTMLLPNIIIICSIFTIEFCFGQRGHSLSRFKATAAFQFPLYCLSSGSRFTQSLLCITHLQWT